MDGDDSNAMERVINFLPILRDGSGKLRQLSLTWLASMINLMTSANEQPYKTNTNW